MSEGAGVILVGMMGSGKSTIGRELAARLDVPFQDTDKLLERALGRSIHSWFAYYGEQAFRQHETRVLCDLEPAPRILATGGGIVLRPENWVQMRRLGTVVFLDVALATLLARLGTTTNRRPLLEAEDWPERVERILTERRPLYEQADLRVVVADEPTETVVDRVLEALVACP